MCAKMPKYIELYSELRRAILNGNFPADSFLPTENELVDQYQVSKTTIRHAVKLLREHKFVEVKQGSGTRVLPLEQETVIGTKYNVPDSKTDLLVRYITSGAGEVNNTKAVADRIPASEAVAAALKISPGSMVCRLQRLQLVDGTPFGYMVNYISEETAPDLLSKGELTVDLYGHLLHHYGIQVTDIEETVDAMTASFMEAQYLQVEVGAPLLLLRRVASGNRAASSESKMIVEYCETTVRPDLFHMTIKITHQGTPELAPFL